MTVSTTVSRRIKRKAPRAFLKTTFKQNKPRLRLETSCDLLVSPALSALRPNGRDRPRRGQRRGTRKENPELFKNSGGKAPSLIASQTTSIKETVWLCDLIDPGVEGKPATDLASCLP